MSKESNKNLQDLVQLCLKEHLIVNFKQCTECNRNLPAHEWFYHRHPHGKYGFNPRCKECVCKSDFAAYEILNPWYENIVELYKDFRKMSANQLETKYKKNIYRIGEHLQTNGYCADRNLIFQDLSRNEIIYMYSSILRAEIKSFSNGIFKNGNAKLYITYLLTYLINDILQWKKEDIISNYCTKTLDDHKLTALSSFGLFKVLDWTFPEYHIKPWELKSSSCKWDERTLLNFKYWFTDKLLQERNITNIAEAAIYGFRKLIDEYILQGLFATKFNGSEAKLFEYIFDEKIDMEKFLEINYSFTNSNHDISRLFEGIIYDFTSEYRALDDNIKKTLIDEIARYCEENKKFPKEKDMCKKNGYISRTQYYKCFNKNSFSEVYKYIIPIDRAEKGSKNISLVNILKHRPGLVNCIKCNKEKPFTEVYFTVSKKTKYGLNYVCKQCNGLLVIKRYYAKKGIQYEKIDDISVEDWYDHYYENKIAMPKFCYQDENVVKIIKYVFKSKLNCKTKEQLLTNFVNTVFKMYRIDMLIKKLGGKFCALNKLNTDEWFTEKVSGMEVNRPS